MSCLTLYRRRQLVLLFVYMISALGLRAQSPDDQLSIYSFNTRFLEHLIKEKIDSVRVAHKLKPLYNDSILYVASRYHAGYLLEKGQLSHTEPEYKDKETPQKRAEFFGARNYYVGENVAFTIAGAPVKNKKGEVHVNNTYNQVANDLVIAWVNSPGHYKNMITPEYNATGVAIIPDKSNKRVYAVQKFATILYKYSFAENKDFFSYSNYKDPFQKADRFDTTLMHPHKGKHAHKLTEAKKPAVCNRCLPDSFKASRSHFEFRNSNVYFVSYNPKEIMKLLSDEGDGFAAEIIKYSPYDCGNPEYYTAPSRRNKHCIFSGPVLKPVLYKKALKGFGGGSNPETIKKRIAEKKIRKYEINLGKLPVQLESEFKEINLVLIQKNKVCRVVHFSGFCGDTIDRFFELNFYRDTVPAKKQLADVLRRVRFSIPFEKGKADYSMADFKPVTDSLLSEVFIADSVDISAFASVEGDSVLNSNLAKERAQKMAQAIASNQKDKLAVAIHARENWEMFLGQVAKNSKVLAEFKDKSRVEVEKILADTNEQKKVEPFLKQQRVAWILMKAREHITDARFEKYLRGRLNSFSAQMSSSNPDTVAVKTLYKHIQDSLELLMNVTFYKIKEHKQKPELFALFSHQEHKAFKHYNRLRVSYLAALARDEEVNDAAWCHGFYNALMAVYNQKSHDFFVLYNLFNILQKSNGGTAANATPADWEAYYALLNRAALDTLQAGLAEKLALNGSFKLCRLPEEDCTPEVQQYYSLNMDRIVDYFGKRKLSIDMRNRIASYYLYHHYARQAEDLLLPDFENNINNPEGFKILAKMYYENSQEFPETRYYDFLEILASRMSKADWCSMFIGPCNVSFQALDNKEFKDKYCERCSSYINYIKAPPVSKDKN